MTKARKPTAAPDPPRIGDKVKPGKSEMIYTVSSVSDNGKEVNLYVPDTNLERFRVTERFSGEVVVDDEYGHRTTEGEKTHVYLYSSDSL
jgi:hypothetical protein